MSQVPAAGPDWVRDAVFYQIFPDRFASSDRVVKPGPLEPWGAPPTSHGFKGGDLLGIAEHLDELADLGINALYLTPVFASASNHRYHAYTYERVDPLLGGDAALRELLDRAHERGMHVVLDGVFNHTGRGFWQFHHILENGAQSPYRNWFHLNPDVLAGGRSVVAYPGPGEYAQMGRLAGSPANGSPSEIVLGYQAWWNDPALPKLNHATSEVREHIYSIAEHWLRFGIDGWRLDVPQEIGEPGFWEEFRSRCLAVKADAYLVGEIWYRAPEWLAGDRFHGLMNYPLAEAILSFVGGTRIDMAVVKMAQELGRHVHPIQADEFAEWLTAVMTYYDPSVTAQQLNLLDSHDTPRFITMAGDDPMALRLGTLIQMTLPGAPSVYYGDEVALRGRHDPDCRRGYPWDPASQDLGMRDFMAGLIGFRRSESLVRNGRFEMLAAESSAAAYRLAENEAIDGARNLAGAGAREGAGRSIVVAINAGDAPTWLSIPISGWQGSAAKPIGWSGNDWRVEMRPGPLRGAALELRLPGRQGAIVEIAPEP
jgi:neopullulanase